MFFAAASISDWNGELVEGVNVKYTVDLRVLGQMRKAKNHSLFA